MGGPRPSKILITGAEHPTGLGLARALAGKNVHIIGLCRSHTPCCKSRYWDELLFAGISEDIILQLVAIGERSDEKIALFPASDNDVKRISDQRETLSPYYLFNLPEKHVVDCFLDKALFHHWAMENGFNVPAAFVCDSYEELWNSLKSIPFPVIVKPFIKSRQWEQFSPVHKTFYLQNRRELDAIPFDLFSAAQKILVQQYIPGGDCDVFFCLAYYDRNGVNQAHYTGRKLFQWPPLSGSTAAAVGELNKETFKITEEIFVRAGFKGLGSVEFKKSKLNGKYYITEPTIGRNDLQSGLAVVGGVNIPSIALADLLDRKKPLTKAGKALWIHEEGLVEALREYHRRRCLKTGDLLKFLHPHTGFAFFSLKDPMPAVWVLKNMFKKKI